MFKAYWQSNTKNVKFLIHGQQNSDIVETIIFRIFSFFDHDDLQNWFRSTFCFPTHYKFWFLQLKVIDHGLKSAFKLKVHSYIKLQDRTKKTQSLTSLGVFVSHPNQINSIVSLQSWFSLINYKLKNKDFCEFIKIISTKF